MRILGIVKTLVWIILMFGVGTSIACAQSVIDLGKSDIDRRFFRQDYILTLDVGEAPSYRIRYLDNPYRLVFDFDRIEFEGSLEAAKTPPKGIARIAYGRSAPQQTRMVLSFDHPAAVEEVDFSATETGGSLRIEIDRVSAEAFAGKVETLAFGPVQTVDSQTPRPEVKGEAGKPIIVLDPGHGGRDPGAVRGDVFEKDLVLMIARELAAALIESDRYRVALTRNSDMFVSLRGRRDYAQEIGADLFISIHADAIREDYVSGSAVYILGEEASSVEAARFAELENRSDHLAGLPRNDEAEDVTRVLIDLVRVDTNAQSEDIARRVQKALSTLAQRPDWSRFEEAAFAVLKAPDVPSILLEVGFMSNEFDRNRMQDKNWRKVLIGQLQLALDAHFDARNE